MEDKKISFYGFHGTDKNLFSKIKINNFNPSFGDDEWLGTGAYFFVDGLQDSSKDTAKNWAIASSWDKKNKIHIYKNYIVIKVKINVNDSNFLDLTNNEGLKIYNKLIDKYIEKLKKANKQIGKNKSHFIDGKIINEFRNHIPIKVVKGNVYIKFTKERIHNINSRIPNVTIVCVYNPIENIEIKDIILEQEGEIP